MKIKKNGEWVDFSLPVAIPTMTGASSSSNGSEGLVPAPAAGDQDKYLKADGTWEIINVPNDVVRTSDVANSANKIPRYNADGHLVLPDGSEFWIA